VSAGPAAAASSAGGAKTPGVLLTGNARTNFIWRVTDAAGSIWDIAGTGAVANGSNGAYSSNGMMLSVNGSSFNWGSEGVLSEDKREVQVGPWDNGKVRVWRRVCSPAKGAYCRWIDIFENTGSASQTAKVRYQMYMGGDMQVLQSPSGKESPAPGEWCFLTADSPNNGAGRPTVVHIFADKGSKVLPKVTAARGNNTIMYEFDLPSPAGKAVALCLFESQQRSASAAQEFMKKFRPGAELQSVAPELRNLIANMRGGFFAAGGIEMPRDEKFDLAVLRESGNELLGTIEDPKFVLETPFGKLELPAERVVGLAVPPDTDSCVQIALTDGQIVSGKLLSDPLKLKLESGSEMSLPAAKINTIAYRISPQKPDQAPLSQPTLVTRSGQRLYYKAADVSYAFLTEAGQIDLRAEDLSAICLETPEGGLHRAIFRNGSVLAGLLVQKDLQVALDLGPTLRCPASALTQFVFPGEMAPTTGLCEATLRNDDVLGGRIAQESIQIKTRFGDVKVAREDLAELKLAEGTMDRLELKLHNGTIVTGLLVGEKIRFQIVPGPELPLFIGHLVKITCPKPPIAATTQATSATTAASSDDPKASTTGDPLADKIKARRLAELGASAAPAASAEGSGTPKENLRKQLESIQDKQKTLQAMVAELAARAAELSRLGKNEEAKKSVMEEMEMQKQIADLDAQAKKLAVQLKEMSR
jgi:hypothetical protein